MARTLLEVALNISTKDEWHAYANLEIGRNCIVDILLENTPTYFGRNIYILMSNLDYNARPYLNIYVDVLCELSMDDPRRNMIINLKIIAALNGYVQYPENGVSTSPNFIVEYLRSRIWSDLADPINLTNSLNQSPVVEKQIEILSDMGQESQNSNTSSEEKEQELLQGFKREYKAATKTILKWFSSSSESFNQDNLRDILRCAKENPKSEAFQACKRLNWLSINDDGLISAHTDAPTDIQEIFTNEELKAAPGAAAV